MSWTSFSAPDNPRWMCTDCEDRFYPEKDAKEHRCPNCGGGRTIPEE